MKRIVFINKKYWDIGLIKHEKFRDIKTVKELAQTSKLRIRF